MKRKIFRVVIALLVLIGIALIVIRSLPITYKRLVLQRPPSSSDITMPRPSPAWLIVGDEAVLASYGSSCLPVLIFGMGCGDMPAPQDRPDLATAILPADTQAVIVIASTAIKEFHVTVQPWSESPDSVPPAIRGLKAESSWMINKTVFTLEPLGDADDLLLEVTVTYFQGGASYHWRLNPGPTAPISTPHPIFSPISATATETPVPTPNYDQTATAVVQAVVSTVQPRVHSSMLSPDQNWRIETIIYDCTQVTEDGPNAYEQLKLIRVSEGTENVIATQLQYCGGVGAGGLGGLYWSPNSRYFYYTDAREGSPDGLCWYWERPIYRLDVLTQETKFVGEGPLSPDQTKIASWRDKDLVIWDLDEGEVARVPAAVADAKRGPIVWSPDSGSLVYLQNESDCFPFGKSYVIRFDVSKSGQNLLLESDTPSFIHATWDAPDRIALSDERDNQWIYDLVNSKLESAP